MSLGHLSCQHLRARYFLALGAAGAAEEAPAPARPKLHRVVRVEATSGGGGGSSLGPLEEWSNLYVVPVVAVLAASSNIFRYKTYEQRLVPQHTFERRMPERQLKVAGRQVSDQDITWLVLGTAAVAVLATWLVMRGRD